MSDIFLSYASEDRERVRPLAEALAAEGWSVFWDRIIPVGKTWDEVLEEELKAARSLVVVWSKHSIKSEWVKAEANEARRLELPLLPILLDGVLPPLGFRHIHAADFSTWDGKAGSATSQALAWDIKKILGPPATPEPIKPITPEPDQTIIRSRRMLIGVTGGLAVILAMVGLWLFPGALRKTTVPLERPLEKPDFSELEKERQVKTFTNSIGMKFVLIPAGTFQMGSPAGELGRDADEKQHQVTLTQPFYLQQTEVTQGQWQKVMGENPSHFEECGDDCPVEGVSWHEAFEFIAKLNRMEKTNKYRLPTEAEWEYACRAGSKGRWSFGDDAADLGKYAWYDKNSGHKTHPVGQKKPNAWSLCDMHGNVWEWCRDWYGEYPAGPVTDPQGPDAGESRVLRVGSWDNNARRTRSASRSHHFPDGRNYLIGFRVASAF